jgi:hypothetical protein
MDISVANNIWTQLGGRKFEIMTGCKMQCCDETSITIKLTWNKLGASFLRVTLLPTDTYCVEWLRLRNFTLTELKRVDGLHCDQLKAEFESEAGLHNPPLQ